jgi:hypothetical protein
MIYASDNDFLQLSARYSNIDLYSFKHKKVISYPDPTEVENYLLEKCLRGEASDGITNVLSPEDTLVKAALGQKAKQKQIRTPWVEDIIKTGDIPNEVNDKYLRNRMLIDFVYIPEEIETRIINTYEKYQVTGNMKSMSNYFIQHKLRQHQDNILDFTTKRKEV